MRGSAPQTPECKTNLIALPLIGSIRLGSGSTFCLTSRLRWRRLPDLFSWSSAGPLPHIRVFIVEGGQKSRDGSLSLFSQPV